MDGMLVDTQEDPEWELPVVESIDDFELSRAIKERGVPTGQYDVLSNEETVKSCCVNWETLFIQFRNENGVYFLRIRVGAGDVLSSRLLPSFNSKNNNNQQCELLPQNNMCYRTQANFCPSKCRCPRSLMKTKNQHPQTRKESGKRAHRIETYISMTRLFHAAFHTRFPCPSL